MRSLLFQIAPTDPLVFFGLTSLLLLVAVLATYVPARRALKINPVETLHYE